MNRYRDYDNFAWLYNTEWAHYGENIFFPVLKDIAREKLPDGARVLDLCCGTGQLAKVLTENGYKVTGIDGSEEMLRYAKTNAPDAEFILDDARTFRLPPVYNAVFSTFDSLNHIMGLEELQSAFNNVYKCLVNGGIFIFDLNTEKAFEAQWKLFKEVKEKPDYLYTVRGDYDKENKTGQFHCTIFQRKAKNWKRTDIILREKWYSQTEVKSALEKTGFTDIHMYAFDRQMGLREFNDESTKIFYLAQKPSKRLT
jgi:SAM-dependent methyltransferase